MHHTTRLDVVVVGAGNAALCAALSAHEQGSQVLILEKGPRENRGGNSYFTDGAIRCAYQGLDDLRDLMPDLSDAQASLIHLAAYPPDAYYADMERVTHGQTDPALARRLVE
ncbi:tricarballylate dehydrogenase, partial [Streptosporangium nondiastaticum]